MITKETLTKISMLPKILEAAQLLHTLRLIDKIPTEAVKDYIAMNPDINEYMEINS